MNVETYHFKLGGFDCVIINDGKIVTFPFPPATQFANAPKEQLHKALRQHGIEPDGWQRETNFNCLVIDTGAHRVLVDTGNGGAAIFSNGGHLPSGLVAAGLEPLDIDTVILTHGHVDHIAGLTDADSQLAFPNARYVMWQTEWEFWTSEANLAHEEEEVVAIIVRNLLPLKERVHLIETESEILPGVWAVAAPGHTVGHLALAISSGHEQLLHLADAVHNHIHFEYPDWHHQVDFKPKQTAESRRKLFSRAEAEHALVLGYHLSPFPGLGRLIKKGQAWIWQPLSI